jgi:hypothetical protein
MEGKAVQMTRDDIVSVLGPVEDILVAELQATGASVEELREAFGWFNSDEAFMSDGRPLPHSRILEIISLLEANSAEE